MAKTKPTWTGQLRGGHWVKFKTGGSKAGAKTGSTFHVYIRDADNRVIAGPSALIGADGRHLHEHHMKQPGATAQNLLPDEEPSGLTEQDGYNPTAFELGRAATVHAYNQVMAAQEAQGEEGQQPTGPQEGLYPSSGFSNPLEKEEPHSYHARPSYPAGTTPPQDPQPAPQDPQETPPAGPAPAGPAPNVEGLREAMAQAHDDLMNLASAMDRWYPGVAWDDLPAEDRADFENHEGAYNAARQAFTEAAPPGSYDPRGDPMGDESGEGEPAPTPESPEARGDDTLGRLADEMAQEQPAAPPSPAPSPAAPVRMFKNPNEGKSAQLSVPPPATLPPVPMPMQPALPQEMGQEPLPAPIGPSDAERQHGLTTRHYLAAGYPAAHDGIMRAVTTLDQLNAVGQAATGDAAQKARTVERVGKMAADAMSEHGYDPSVREHLLAHTAHVAAGLRTAGPAEQETPPEEGAISGDRLSTDGEDVGEDYLGDLGYRDPGDPNTPAASRRRQKAGFLGGRMKAATAEGEGGEIDLGEAPWVQERQEKVRQRLGTTPGQARIRRRKQTPLERLAWEREMEEQSRAFREKYERDRRADWLKKQYEPLSEELQGHLDHLESPTGHGALTQALDSAIPRARMQGEMEYMQRMAGAKGHREREREKRLHDESRWTNTEEQDLSFFRNLLREYGSTSSGLRRAENMMAMESRIRGGGLRGLALGPAPPTGPRLRQRELEDARAFLAAQGDPRAEPGREHIDPAQEKAALAAPVDPDADIGSMHETPEGRVALRHLVEGTFARNDIENDLHRRMMADVAGRLHKEASGGELDEADLGIVKHASGLLRSALARTRHGAAGAPDYKPDQSLSGHLPYRTMVGERPGGTGVAKLDDMVYNARKAHERGTHPLSPEQFEHLRKLSAALYRLKQVKIPQSSWGRDALREVHALLPGAESFLNAHNPEHEAHRAQLQQNAGYVYDNDPTAPSLAHMRDMMTQHGGTLDLPEAEAAEPVAPAPVAAPAAPPEEIPAPISLAGGDLIAGRTSFPGHQERARLLDEREVRLLHEQGLHRLRDQALRSYGEDYGPEAHGSLADELGLGAGAPAAKSGVLDDVLGAMDDLGAQDEPAQHEAGGGLSIPVEPQEGGGAAQPRPETLAARKRGGPPAGSVALPGFGADEEPAQPAQPEPPRAIFGQTPPPKMPPTASGAPLREPDESEGGIQNKGVGPSQRDAARHEAEGFLLGNMNPEQQLGFAMPSEAKEPPVEKETGPIETGFLDLDAAEEPPEPKEPAVEKETGPVETGFLDLSPASGTGVPPQRKKRTVKGPAKEQMGFLDLEPLTTPEEAEEEPAAAEEGPEGALDEPEEAAVPDEVAAPQRPAAAPQRPAGRVVRDPAWDEEAITRRLPTQRGRPSPLERVPHAEQQEQAARLVRQHAAENILRGGVDTLPEEEEEPEEGAAPVRGGWDQKRPGEVMPFMYTPGATLPPRERHAANVMWHRAGTPAEQVAMLARHAHGFAPHLGRPPEARDPMNVSPADQQAQRKWSVRSARFVRNTIDRMMAGFVPEQTGSGHHGTNQISPMQGRRYRQLGDALLWHAQNEGRIPDPKEFSKLYGASESGRLEDEEDPINHEHVESQLKNWMEHDAGAVARHADELHQHAMRGHDIADGRHEHPRVGPNTLFEASKRLGALAEHKRLWDPDAEASDALMDEYGSLSDAALKEHGRELAKQARRSQFLDHPEHGPINPGTLQAVSDRIAQELSGEGGRRAKGSEAPAADLAPKPATSTEEPIDLAALEQGAQEHSEALAGEGSSLEEATRLARSQAALAQHKSEQQQASQSTYVNQVRQPGGYKGLYDQADYAYRHTSEPEKRLRLGLLRSHLHEIANDPTLSDEERQYHLDRAALSGHGLDDELEDARSALRGKTPKGPVESAEEHTRNVERRAGALKNELREVGAHLQEVGDGPLVRPAHKDDVHNDEGKNWRLYSDADLHAAHLERDIAAMRRGKADHPVVKEAEEALSRVYGNFLRHRIEQSRTSAGTGHGKSYVSPTRLRYELAESMRKMAALRPDHPLLKDAQGVRDELDYRIGTPLGAEDLRKERRKNEEESPHERAMREFLADRTARGLPLPAAKGTKAAPAAAQQPADEAEEEEEFAPPPPTPKPAVEPEPQAEGKLLPLSEGINQAHVDTIVQRAQGQERGDLQRQIDAFHKVAGFEEDVVGQGSQQVTRQTAAEAARRLEEMRDALEARDEPQKATPAPSPAPTPPAPPKPAAPSAPPSPTASGRTAHDALGPVRMGEQLNTPHGPMWVSRYHRESGTVHGQVGDKLMSLNLHEHGPEDVTRLKPAETSKPTEPPKPVQDVQESAYESGFINPLVA